MVNTTTNPPPAGAPERQPSRDEIFTSLFAEMIQQQASTALMLLGKIPNPDTGERFQEPDSARIYIYQMEMIEARTQGNLTPFENDYLSKGLTTIRQAFHEVTGQDITPAPSLETSHSPDSLSPVPSVPIEAETPPKLPLAPPAPPESRKRYSKTY